MTSHGSWIDQDEINHLVNSLGGKEPQQQPPRPKLENSDAETSPQADVDKVAEDSMTDPAPDATPEEATPSSEDETGDDKFMFSLGQEEPRDDSTEEMSPGKANVVNVLKEARKRANRGGLLRGIKKGVSPLWPDFPPLEEEVKPQEAEPEAEASPFEISESGPDDESATVGPAPSESSVVEQPPVPTESIFEAVEPADEEEIPEEKAPFDIASLKNLPIRKRLEGFADQALGNLGASSIAITDFLGYPLLQRGSDNGMGTTTAATLVTDQLNQLSEALGAPEHGSTQISLAEDRWLCLVEAKSATGGVLAQLQVTEPLDSGETRQFRQDLEAVLAGWN